MRLPRPCIDCDELSPESRCPQHRREHEASHRRPNRLEREARNYGAGTGHRARSRRLRARQRFCLDCGTDRDLVIDHLPSAALRTLAGLPQRDQDYEVVCRRCNALRGPALGRQRDAYR